MSTWETNGYLIRRPMLDDNDIARAIAHISQHTPQPNGQIPLAVRMSPVIAEIAGAIADEMPMILEGQRLFCHWPPMIRMVTPNNTAAAVPAHQDIAYNRHIAGPFITAWVTLTAIDNECGGLAVWPGSHRFGELTTASTYHGPDHWLAPATYDGPHHTIAPLKAAQAIIMHSHLLHESMPNHSDHNRISLDLRFFDEHAQSSKHFMDMDTGRVFPAHAEIVV